MPLNIAAMLFAAGVILAGCTGQSGSETTGSKAAAHAEDRAESAASGAQQRETPSSSSSSHASSAATTGASAAAIDADRLEASLSAAEQYLQTQDLAKARAILVTLLDRMPQEIRAREMLGQVLTLEAARAETQGDPARAHELRLQAHEQYQKVIELQPNIAGLQHSAGLMAMAAGQTDTALACFMRAGELEPDNAQYPIYAAQLLIAQRRFDEAIAALERALAIDPDEPITHASLAMIAMERERFDEAFEHMAEARRLNPADLGLRAQEARIHRRSGNPKRGVELLVGLSEADRCVEYVAVELAAGYEAMNAPMDAARVWARCYQADPLNPRAWLLAVRAGEALLKAGEIDQARLWLQDAMLAAPEAQEVRRLQQAIAQHMRSSP